MLTEFSGENLVVPLAMKLNPAQMQLHHLLVGDFDTAWIGPCIGLGVSWKIVPAVTDLCRPQRPRSNQALRSARLILLSRTVLAKGHPPVTDKLKFNGLFS